MVVVKKRRQKGDAAAEADIALTEPEATAAVIDTLAEPFKRLKQLGEELGLDPLVVTRMIQRVKSRYQPVLGELQEIKTSDLTRLLDDRAHRALQYLDDSTLAASSAKDLAIVIGIMLEKRQLLRGEPTQILSTEERMSLRDLMPELVREAKRRGLVIDLSAEDAIVTPEDPEQVRVKIGQRPIHVIAEINQAKQKREIGEP